MGIFKTSKLLYGNPDFINTIATVIESKFRADGHDVRVEDTNDNGKNIDISKGGVFKRVLGMRTALKVSLSPCDGNIWFKTDVGIFGNHVIPTIPVASGMWFVLLPQIWVLCIRQDLMTLHWRSRKELYMLPEESKNSYLYMTNCRLCIKDEMKAQTS